MVRIHTVTAGEVQVGDVVLDEGIPYVTRARLAKVIAVREETYEDVEIVVHGARWTTSKGNHVQVVR